MRILQQCPCLRIGCVCGLSKEHPLMRLLEEEATCNGAQLEEIDTKQPAATSANEKR